MSEPHRTCPSGKRRLVDEREAKTELVGAILKRNKGSQRRRECRYYECPICKGWHLTSQPKPTR